MSQKIKWRTEFDDDCNKFVTNSGNGEAVPQYEFIPKYGRHDGILKLKVDKDGVVVTKNLYKEIQEAGVGCEIQSLLQSNPELMTDIGRGNSYANVNYSEINGDISKFKDCEWDDYFNMSKGLIDKYKSEDGLSGVTANANQIVNEHKVLSEKLKKMDQEKRQEKKTATKTEDK